MGLGAEILPPVLELKAVIVPLGHVVFWDTQVINVLGDHSGGSDPQRGYWQWGPGRAALGDGCTLRMGVPRRMEVMLGCYCTVH